MKEVICTSCHFVGPPKKYVKGSILVEIALWLFSLVPGLIYSLWRLSSKWKGCASCGQPTIIPVESPRGRELVASLSMEHELPEDLADLEEGGIE